MVLFKKTRKKSFGRKDNVRTNLQAKHPKGLDYYRRLARLMQHDIICWLQTIVLLSSSITVKNSRKNVLHRDKQKDWEIKWTLLKVWFHLKWWIYDTKNQTFVQRSLTFHWQCIRVMWMMIKKRRSIDQSHILQLNWKHCMGNKKIQSW